MASVINSEEREDPAMFSRRATRLMQEPSFLVLGFVRAMQNPFDVESNPTGIINMGTAENTLCCDLLQNKMKEVITFKRHCQFYASPIHMERAAEKVRKFFFAFLGCKETLETKQIAIYNGATSIIAGLANVLADPGDYFMTPSPYYSQMASDVGDMGGVNICFLPLANQVPDIASGPTYVLTAEALDEALEAARAEGKNVRGFLLTNPSNPLGDIYSQSLVLELMEVCKRHGIHFISDEVYALTVFKEDATFNSVLSFDELPDPDRTHFIWSASKDFSMSGMRFGVYVGWNEKMVGAMQYQSYLFGTALIGLEAFVDILADIDWLKNVYFPTNIRRIRESYHTLTSGLEKLNVSVRESSAGFFVWINLHDVLLGRDHGDEMKFFSTLMSEHGVYFLPGNVLASHALGCFRVVFTHPKPVLEQALLRLEEMIQRWKSVVTAAEKFLKVKLHDREDERKEGGVIGNEAETDTRCKKESNGVNSAELKNTV